MLSFADGESQFSSCQGMYIIPALFLGTSLTSKVMQLLLCFLHEPFEEWGGWALHSWRTKHSTPNLAKD